MRFEIIHEFDAPIAAVEHAVMSPELALRLARRLVKSIESIEALEHRMDGGELVRVLEFQASAPLGVFRGHKVARDAMSWQERWTYRPSEHASTWSVAPKEKYRKYFRSEGTYRLEALAGGRTRRTVLGDLEIRVGFVAGLVERLALSEVRKTYDAEAATLRELAAS